MEVTLYFRNKLSLVHSYLFSAQEAAEGEDIDGVLAGVNTAASVVNGWVREDGVAEESSNNSAMMHYGHVVAAVRQFRLHNGLEFPESFDGMIGLLDAEICVLEKFLD